MISKNKKKIRVAIVGVGNCASSLIQGLHYYHTSQKSVTGLMHQIIGGYRLQDIEVVSAFDVNKTKVGKDLSEAIYQSPNNTKKFFQVPKTGVTVSNAPPFDGIGKYVEDIITTSNQPIVDPIKLIQKAQVDVIVNYLPVGSELATQYWAQVSLKTGAAFINCVPVFIASNKKWAEQFQKENIPIIGDDIKSQIGATIVHRTLTNLFLDRGMPIDHTYQLNVGGNTDFLNMLERERLSSKKISKTRSVTSQIQLRNQSINDEDVHIGPSDYVPWLKDNKVAFIRIEGKHFGDVPMHIEVRLSVEDSPNSAGVVVDAIRCARLALDRGVGGPILGPSAYFMKSPPVQYTDSQAKHMVESFISE